MTGFFVCPAVYIFMRRRMLVCRWRKIVFRIWMLLFSVRGYLLKGMRQRQRKMEGDLPWIMISMKSSRILRYWNIFRMSFNIDINIWWMWWSNFLLWMFWPDKIFAGGGMLLLYWYTVSDSGLQDIYLTWGIGKIKAGKVSALYRQMSDFVKHDSSRRDWREANSRQ